MKKLLALMVAMIMVFGLASFAIAEIEFSGDARVRGTLKDNPDYDSDTEDSSRWYDSRIRMNITGTNDDGAGVKIRLTMDEQSPWNNAPQGSPQYHGDDYAYLFIPVADNWTVTAGFMPKNWGHKFWGWGSAASRLKITGKLDVAVVGAFTQKVSETLGMVDANDEERGDYDVNAIFAITKLGEFKVGGIFVMASNDTNLTNSAAAPDFVNADSTDGTQIDVFFQGAVGDITILGELVQQSGDLYETAAGDSPNGAFIAAAMNLDTIKVSAAIAMTKNNYVTTIYFTPTVLIGTAQPSALFNLGECGEKGGDTCDTMAIVLTADTKLSDEMGIGAVLAYATIDGYSDDQIEGTWTEIDAKFSYALGEQTKYWANFGYGMPDVEYGGVDLDLDSAYAITHGVSYKF